MLAALALRVWLCVGVRLTYIHRACVSIYVCLTVTYFSLPLSFVGFKQVKQAALTNRLPHSYPPSPAVTNARRLYSELQLQQHAGWLILNSRTSNGGICNCRASSLRTFRNFAHLYLLLDSRFFDRYPSSSHIPVSFLCRLLSSRLYLKSKCFSVLDRPNDDGRWSVLADRLQQNQESASAATAENV